MQRHNLLSRCAFALVALALIGTVPVLGADSLFVCQPGVPFVYPAGGANILWNPDQGGLGSLTNAQAIAAVKASFDAWENLPQSSVTYLQGPTLAIDIDETNFGPIFDGSAGINGESEIVFDEDGAIFSLLFGPGSGILGFAGPDFGNFTTCELIEGSAFLNGPAFLDALEAEDIMVHEFGHYSNLGHVELNGQLVSFSEGGDDSGPSPDNVTFGAPSSFVGTEVIETMYPFYFGTSAVGTRTPHADDIASIATLYPDPTFASSTGSIRGTIFSPNGTTRVSGVNVIARRLNAAGTGGDGDLSFTDAVSTFSGAYTNGTAQSDPFVGIYELNNLTPGASYAVFVDTVTAAAGRFSNPIATQLPGPEEYYDSAESNSNPPDDPLVFVGVAVAAGNPNTGIDIIFNQPGPGDPLPVGDDGSVALALPFTFCMQGEPYESLFVNANGNITFGAGDSDFSESAADFLDGPPRIAGMWHDLNPAVGGSVFYNETADSFTVTWENVPEWFATGANTFDITLYDNSSTCTPGGEDNDGVTAVEITHRSMDLTDGIVGVSGGIATTSGAEAESNISARTNGFLNKSKLDKEAAIFENYVVGDGTYDLLGESIRFNRLGRFYNDDFEDNDSLDEAASIEAPFASTDTFKSYTSIEPAAADIDFFELGLVEGQTLIAQVTRGQIDSVLGLFFCPGSTCNSADAIFIGFNDDLGFGSNPLLSGFLFSVPITGTYALGVTFCCDYDFDGVDPGQGAPFDGGRYVLDVQVINGTLLALGDDDFEEVVLGFDFPIGGSTYDSVFINSNGSLTFGAGDTDFSESIGEFEEVGNPRIAALWDDLSPNQGGFVFYNADAGSFSVTFQDVPQFVAGDSNNFTVTIDSAGNVDVSYGNVDANDGIVGVYNGAGFSTAVDLSATGGGNVADSPVEQFTFGSPFDLPPGTILTFIP